MRPSFLANKRLRDGWVHRRSIRMAGVLAALSLAFAALCAAAAASPSAHAAGATPSARAAAVGPAPAGQSLQLVIPLVADDAGLSRFAAAVSTPGSPLYAHYLSVPALARRYGARAAARRRVVDYLRSVGATGVAASPTGMYVAATMTVAVAERTFGTSLASFRTAQGERFIAPVAVAHAASAAAGIPRPLHGLVLGVVGLDTRPVVPSSVPRRTGPALRASAAAAPFQPPSEYLPVSGTPSGCPGALSSGGFTPNQYLTAYDYDPLRDAGLDGEGERVAVIEIDRFKPSDLATFARCFHLHVPPISVYAYGPQSAIPLGVESTLDLEVLDAAAPDLTALEVFDSNGDAAQVDQSFVAPLVAPGAKAQVISASLGLCESDMEQAFGWAGIRTVERGLQLAAATGISVLASSGDTGSAECVDGDAAPVDRLAANYPASSQWVTAVGGTNIELSAANTLQSQTVWNDTTDQIGAGGGGFSALFPRPAYQNGVVAQAFRALPDVSLVADVAPGYAIYCSVDAGAGCGGWTTVGGTSAATPLLAGGIALVNQDLHRNHRELIGFLNPLLYQLGAGSAAGQVFSDVTRYGNDIGPYIPGGDGRPLGCCTAAPGYDEASGWGSVNLAHLDATALQVLPQFGDVALSVLRRQRPVKHHRILLRLTCSEACTVFGFGFVTIRHAHSFVLRTGNYAFIPGGSKTISIRFTRRQEQWLRQGLRHHRVILAEIFAGALDARGQVAEVTSGQVLTIRG